jgi:virulence factor Mce-like protein
LAPNTITAHFTSVTALYVGDEVRVAGVKVGTIDAIEPDGDTVKMTLNVDREVSIPADARAVIVAQNLIAARYVQLAPAYDTEGPVMADGADVPVSRTAVPVEWDQVKQQLMRLATDLGPHSGAEQTAAARFIDSAATAMADNGGKLRETLAQLSAVGRVLADGSGDISDIIENLDVFVRTLSASNDQLMLFQDRLATLTSVVDNSRSSLDAMLQSLSVAVSDIQRFVSATRDKTADHVARLADVTQNLVDHTKDLQNILHVAPNAVANQMNIYNPDSGAAVGAFVFNNMSNPMAFICGSIGAIENATAPEAAKLCAQYLGPALKTMNFNYIPFPLAPFLAPAPSANRVVYSEPRLAPGGEGPKPDAAPIPSPVSAYTGLDQQPATLPGAEPERGNNPGPSPTLPVSPPLDTPAPAHTLPQLLLPAEVPNP